MENIFFKFFSICLTRIESNDVLYRFRNGFGNSYSGLFIGLDVNKDC